MSKPRDPTLLPSRHERAAVLQGTMVMPLDGVARACGLTKKQMKRLQDNKLYQERVAEVRACVVHQVFDLTKALERDREEVYKRKLELMRQDDNLPVAHAATDSLFQIMVAPIKEAQAAATPKEHVHRVVLTTEEQERHRKVLLEAGRLKLIDVTPEEKTG